MEKISYAIWGNPINPDTGKEWTQEEMAELIAKQKKSRLEEILGDLGFTDNTDYYMPKWIIDMCEKLLEAGWVKE